MKRGLHSLKMKLGTLDFLLIMTIYYELRYVLLFVSALSTHFVAACLDGHFGQSFI